MSNKETKVCKVCGKEKPIKLFISGTNKCKVCNYHHKNPTIALPTEWNNDELNIVLNSLYSGTIEYIDEILLDLSDKNMDDLVELLDIIKIGGTTRIRIKKHCGYCNNAVGIKPYHYKEKRDNYFCCNTCSARFYGEIKTKEKQVFTKTCQCCGKEFTVDTNRENRGKNKYCSPECSQQSQVKRIEVNCSYCGNPKDVTPSVYNNQKNHFCNSICEHKFRTEQAREIRTCEICRTEYESMKISTQRFCSSDCQIQWQKQYSRTGEDHPSFTSELVMCDWCGKDFYANQYKLNSNQKSFTCSDECRQAYYSNITSQTEEWKNFHRIKAVNMLSSGVFEHTDTEPQLALNKILDENDIDYINEYNCKYVAIDNYLTEHNLMIECNGTYWHTDNRFYSTINYIVQRNRIKHDKIKNTYIKNNYNINILHIWEFDIMNNPQLCIGLINKYIDTKGILDNYHSFNYSVIDGEISLNKDIIIPYMDWDADKLSKIVDISVKKKMSQKQHEKWIQFKCECCGKTTEQLISRYNKAKNHFCSWDCSHEFRRGKTNSP